MFTSVFPALETSKSPAGLGPKLATTNKKVGKGKLGFMAMEADRTTISFHMYLLPFLCIQSFQAQLSKRHEMSVSEHGRS